VVVNYIREYQLHRGLPADQAYNVTMYVLAAFLLVGVLCNLSVRPVAERHFMSDDELAAERVKAHEGAVSAGAGAQAEMSMRSSAGLLLVVLAWIAVGVPLLWGIWTTLAKALPLFRMG
jgi:hypothetical protein